MSYLVNQIVGKIADTDRSIGYFLDIGWLFAYYSGTFFDSILAIIHCILSLHTYNHTTLKFKQLTLQSAVYMMVVLTVCID